jgi:phosphatidylserine/phosphatidylglycerophosphate/cardiolipin synthase-like enzyme
MIEIRGPVVLDWKTLFEGVWNRSSPGHLRLVSCPEFNEPENMHGRVICSRPMKSNIIARSVVRHGLLAQTTVWMATAYFAPPWRLRRMLRRKAKQNVDVRILLPGHIADHPSVWHFGRRHYSSLLHAGVRIFEYQPQFMHSKVALCDSWCSIGSSNLDRWKLPMNLEANQEVVDPLFANQLKTMLENDFKNSKEIHYVQWKNRRLIFRLKEWFWSIVAKFFEK